MLLLFFFWVPTAAGADVSVTLKLDRSEATLSDTVGMVVSVKGTREISGPPTLQGVALFHVTGGGTSSRVQVINGKVNASLDYTYTLQPGHTGTFKLGPALVTVAGKTYASNTVRLLVKKPSQAEGSDRGPLFLTAELSKKDVVVEEQTVYILKLHRRVDVRDISLNLPELEGLTFNRLGNPRKYRSVHNGRPYEVLEVRYALVPSKEGVYALEPARMNMTLLQSGDRSPFGGLFDDSFFSFGRGKPGGVASESLELTVGPLPEAGRPVGFSGLVGQFEIESSLQPPEVKAGESVTLTVRVKGRGNVNLVPDMNLPALERIKVYADQPVLEIQPDDKGMAGEKTMKWALVPEKEGRVEMPPLALTFFDTDTRTYRTLKTGPHEFSVLPGERSIEKGKEGENKGRVSGPEKEEVTQIGRDILPPHTAMKDFLKPTRLRPRGWAFWVLLLIPCFVYLGAFGLQRLRRKAMGSRAESKAKRAARDFRKKCRRGGLSSSDLILFIRGYMNDRFGLSLGALTPDEAAEILKTGGATEDSLQKMRARLQELEDAVYTGKGHLPCKAGNEIESLILKIDKEIR